MNTSLLVHRHPENYTGTADTSPPGNLVQAARLPASGPRQPVFERTPVGTCGTPPPLGGYTLITANDFTEVVELAKACPILEEGGGVEAGLPTPVPGRKHPARIF
jgi:hypothetical protein